MEAGKIAAKQKCTRPWEMQVFLFEDFAYRECQIAARIDEETRILPHILVALVGRL